MMSPRPQGDLTVERLCLLAGVSRAGYYRQWAASMPRQEETAIRDAVQRVGTCEPPLWLSAGHERAFSQRYCGQPQTRAAADARRQSTVPAHTSVRADDN